MIARAYSTKLNAVDVAYASHVKYVQTILTVPISKVEREVEKYFSGIYRDLSKTVFNNPLPFGRMLDANERDEADEAVGSSA
jgi:prephenate dehydrogenase